MKKLSLLFLMMASTAGAQDIYETMSREVCDCIRTKRPDLSITAPADLKDDYMSCFLLSFGKHTETIMSMEGGKFSDRENMAQFGEGVAMKMLVDCPDYLMALGTAMQDDEMDASEVVYTTVEGKVSEIKTDQFITVVLKDKYSKTHHLLLMDFFETASLLTENKIKKNSNISATYSEIEMYDPKLKEFRYYKVLTALEMK